MTEELETAGTTAAEDLKPQVPYTMVKLFPDTERLASIFAYQTVLNERYHKKGAECPLTARQLDKGFKLIAEATDKSDLAEIEEVISDLAAKLRQFEWTQMVAVEEWATSHAVAREFAEFLESLGTLWFKPKETPDYGNAYLELADILFFLMTHWIGSRGPVAITALSSAHIAMEPTELISKQVRFQDMALDTIGMAPESFCGLVYNFHVCVEKAAGRRYDFTGEEIQALFSKLLDIWQIKEALNYFRLDNGLFTGDYQKHIFGTEDNIVWQGMVDINYDEYMKPSTPTLADPELTRKLLAAFTRMQAEYDSLLSAEE